MNKLTIKEYDFLLCNKSIENKNAFIEAFIPYIYKYAMDIYNDNKELFNAYYSLDDLISDGSLIATELYDYIVPDRSIHPFTLFIKYFRIRLFKALANAYFIKVDVRTLNKLYNILKVKRDYMEDKNVIPDSKTLQELSGYKKMVTKKAMEQINFCDVDLGSYEIEEDILNRVLNDEMHNSIMEKLQELNERDCIIISLVFGLLNNIPRTYEEVGEMYHLSKQRVYEICKEFFVKFRNDLPSAKKYLKEL